MTRSLKICLFLFVCICLSGLSNKTVVAFDLSDEDEIYRYFNTYKERDWIILEVIREPIYFSIKKTDGTEEEIALLPLEISIEGRGGYTPHKPKNFLVFTKENAIWYPIGGVIKKNRISRLFGREAELALFKAGY